MVGYYEEGELFFAGKVGTGFSEKTLFELGESSKLSRSRNLLFSEAAGSPETPIGSNRSWSVNSPFRNGRGTESCATLVIWAFAKTSERRKSFARFPGRARARFFFFLDLEADHGVVAVVVNRKID